MKRLIVVLSGGLLAIAGTVSSASLTWDSNGVAVGVLDGPGTWDTSNSNWWNGATNVVWNNASNDTAVIGNNNGAAGIITLGTAITAGGITFNPPGSGTYTINSNTITLAGATPTIDSSVALVSAPTINSGLAGTGGITKSGTGAVIINGTATYTGGTTLSGGIWAVGSAGSNGTGNITLNGGTFRGFNGNTFSSNFIANNVAGNQLDTGYGEHTLSGNLSGSGNVAQIGANRLNISGNNSGYSGTYTLSSGQLRFLNTSAASASAAWVANGSFLVFGSATSGTFEFGALSGSAATYNDFATTATMQVGALGTDTSYSGVIGGGVGGSTTALTKVGAGTFTLTGANTFTGNIIVNGGTLTQSTSSNTALGSRTATRTITINSSGTLELPGTYRLANGSGAALPGSSITIDGGTLRNSATVSAQFDVINNLTMRNGATLTANSSTYGASYQAFQLRGNVTVANTGGNTSPSSIVGGTGTNRGLHLFTNTTFDVADVTGTTAADLTVSTELLNQNGDLANAAGALTKSGAGRMDLTAYNTFTGGTTVNDGTLALNTSGATGTGTVRGAVTVNAGATLLSLNRETFGWNGANRVSTLNLVDGTFTHNFNQVQTFWGATVNMTGATLQTITDGGTLQFGTDGNAGNIPSAINVLASPTTSTISRTGTNQTLSVLQANLTFDVADGAAATDLQVSLPITGAGRSITKANSGTMALGFANSHSGGTIVNGGRLIGSVTGSLGSGTVTVNTGGTVSWAANGYNTFPSIPFLIAGGTVSVDSSTNNAHNYFNQTMTMQGGTLTSINGLAGPANDGGYGNFILNNSTLTVSGSAQSTISTTTFGTTATSNFNVGVTGAGVDLLVQSQIVGASPIVKNGLGTMKLTAANVNTSLTTINAGTLLVSNTTGSGVGTNNVSINGGRLGGVGFVGTSGDASNVSFGALGGSIAPGESAGVLTVSGDVNFTSAGSAAFAVELNGPTVGSLYDQLVVNSATGGTDTINLANAALQVSLGFTPSLGNQFTILNNNTPSSITGTFAGLANNSTFLVNTTTFRINYDAGSGNDVVLTVVPEPGSFSMLLFASLMLLLVRKKRS